MKQKHLFHQILKCLPRFHGLVCVSSDEQSLFCVDNGNAHVFKVRPSFQMLLMWNVLVYKYVFYSEDIWELNEIVLRRTADFQTGHDQQECEQAFHHPSFSVRCWFSSRWLQVGSVMSLCRSSLYFLDQGRRWPFPRFCFLLLFWLGQEQLRVCTLLRRPQWLHTFYFLHIPLH